MWVSREEWDKLQNKSIEYEHFKDYITYKQSILLDDMLIIKKEEWERILAEKDEKIKDIEDENASWRDLYHNERADATFWKHCYVETRKLYESK